MCVNFLEQIIFALLLYCYMAFTVLFENVTLKAEVMTLGFTIFIL